MTESHSVRRPASILGDLPPAWGAPLLASIRGRRREQGRPLVVLDDDPMSGQSLYEVPVLTTWDAVALAAEMQQGDIFVILTDARALGREEALARMREIGAALREAAAKAGVEVDIALRGDSTLRGHFPADLDALLETLLPAGAPRPICVFAPYFGEAGRLTLDDTQYVVEGDELVPVAETQFARDPAFGYVESHLPSWLSNRLQGGIEPDEIARIGIDDLRVRGPEVTGAKLASLAPGSYVVANAVDNRDLEVLAEAMTHAEAQGRRFVSVSAAPFVRVRLGMPRRELVGGREVLRNGRAGGGLTIVGSYIDRTREQLAYTLAQSGVSGIEVDVEEALRDPTTAISKAARDVELVLGEARDVVLHLGQGRPSTNADRAISEGRHLSEALAVIVRQQSTRPRYVMVKGGSTASHIVREGLGVRRAMILGQLLSGVPIWRLGSESRWPEMPFVIFAGNVGEREGLYEAVTKLRAEDS